MPACLPAACLPAVASLDNRMSVWEGLRCLMVLTCQKPSPLHWMTLSVTHDRCQCSMPRPLLPRSDCGRWLFYSSLFSIGKPWAQPSLQLPSAEMAAVSLHSCPPQWHGAQFWERWSHCIAGFGCGRWGPEHFVWESQVGHCVSGKPQPVLSRSWLNFLQAWYVQNY